MNSRGDNVDARGDNVVTDPCLLRGAAVSHSTFQFCGIDGSIGNTSMIEMALCYCTDILEEMELSSNTRFSLHVADIIVYT